MENEEEEGRERMGGQAQNLDRRQQAKECRPAMLGLGSEQLSEAL